MSVPADAFVIVQVARLDYLKDHTTAVRAIHALAKSTPNVLLLLVGEGPERPKIEAEIALRGLQKNVRLLGQRNDVPQILQAADAMLLTSISEGIPLTLIEGMAAGLPIVSTDVGGVREVVVEEETALLAAAGDDAALARRLQQLLADNDLRRRLGSAGRRLRQRTVLRKRDACAIRRGHPGHSPSANGLPNDS